MSKINWDRYLAYFDQIKTKQKPMEERKRDQLESVLSELLGFAAVVEPWGTAGGFGNGTEVVVELHTRPQSDSWAKDLAGFEGPLAVRVLRDKDAGDLVRFHATRAKDGAPVNGPEFPHFQRSFAGKYHRSFAVAVHEWMPGETLEWWHRNVWNNHPLEGLKAKDIILQVLKGIVIPAWSAAGPQTGVLWDLRDANFVVCDDDDKLRVAWVDIGNLRHVTLNKIDSREGQMNKGCSGIKTLIQRILESQGKTHLPRGWKKRMETILAEVGLNEKLKALPGGNDDSKAEAGQAVDALMKALIEAGMLPGGEA
jgi:hypothetical protein